MDTIGQRTIRRIYEDFTNHFKDGNIVIAGSCYYKKLGCEVKSNLKDVDIIIDKNKDYIVHQILDYYEQSIGVESSFRNYYDEGLIGSFRLKDGYVGVDLLRNDFANLVGPIEIISDVWSYGLSDKVLFETYKELAEKLDDERYPIIRDFFKLRL